MAGGLLLLFFTTYLLWGTGVYTKSQQTEARARLARSPVVDADSLANGKIPPARPTTDPDPGDPLFSIKIPKIGLDTVVVHGVGVEELKKGPGLFPDCAARKTEECVEGAMFPGEDGNVSVSGHRTTYGAPFFRLNELKDGDTIDFVSGRARYRYRVRGQKIVDPVSGFVEVEQAGRRELTLTTCHPRFSARQRLIVKADYEGSSLIPRSSEGDSRKTSAPTGVVPRETLVLAAVSIVAALGSLALSVRYRRVAVGLTVAALGAGTMWVSVFPWIVSRMPANY